MRATTRYQQTEGKEIVRDRLREGRQEGAPRAGHNPRCHIGPWASAVNEHGTFESADELSELHISSGVIDPGATRPAGIARRFSAPDWRAQLLLFAAAYGLYNAARWLFVGDLSQAQGHAEWIMQFERDVGVAIEGSVQRSLDSALWSWLFSNVYMAAQLVVLPASLIWLYRRDREIYRKLRNAILVTWLIAVPIYAIYPVAPPRLADAGIVDTVSDQAGFALTGRSTVFYNPLAAVPSLHVGFAFAIGVAVATAVRTRWAKALALLWGPLVALAVVATGNHYVFDIAAGLVVTAVGFAVARLISRHDAPGRVRGRVPPREYARMSAPGRSASRLPTPAARRARRARSPPAPPRSSWSFKSLGRSILAKRQVSRAGAGLVRTWRYRSPAPYAGCEIASRMPTTPMRSTCRDRPRRAWAERPSAAVPFETGLLATLQ